MKRRVIKVGGRPQLDPALIGAVLFATMVSFLHRSIAPRQSAAIEAEAERLARPAAESFARVVAFAIGFVLTFAPELIGQVQTTGLGIVGIALMLGGAGALVWHMRDAPPTDRGPDDGAVV